MNELQYVEYMILKCVVGILDKLNIRYYLVCGSALGAVKYQGFIPWDDDIDIALDRKDYEFFIDVASNYLPPYYFLQNFHTEDNVPNIFTKIRDSRTTYIEKSVSMINMNHGVYIDIFPLDEYPQKRISKRLLEVRKWRLRHKISCVYAEPRKGLSELYRRYNVFMGYDKKTKKSVKRLDHLLSKYSGNGSNIICNHANWQGKLEYAPKEQYGKGVYQTFEKLLVRIPENYNDYLTQKYGDWREDLPEEEKKGHHYAAVIDLNRPYTCYIRHLENGKIEIKTKDEVERQFPCR